MTWMEGIGVALWWAICWWLRGGKYGAIHRTVFRFEPGTTLTRIVCAALMVSPLAYLGYAPWTMVISVYLAMTLGYFWESMGVLNWKDVLGMGVWGVTVATVLTAPLWAAVGYDGMVEIHGHKLSAAIALAFELDMRLPLFVLPAALSGVNYYVQKQFGRALGLDWTERGELVQGVLFSLAYLGFMLW